MTTPKPFVLVHGSWHDGQVWHRVVPLLQGHRVLTPSLTGRGDTAHLLRPTVGLNTYVNDIVDVIVGQDLYDVVLVGHSYAGLVISSVANRIPERIGTLVYLDAMVPRHGETTIDILPFTRELIDNAASWRIPPLPQTPDGLFGVTDPDDIAWLKTILVDEPALCFEEPVQLDNPAQAAIRRVHIHCTAGPGTRRPVDPIQPNGTPAEIHELSTGHDAMLTQPAELSAILLRL